MKKRLVLTLFLLVNVLTYAQLSTSFVEIGKQWNICHTYWNGTLLTYSYKISEEDTVYNGHTYNKVEISRHYNYNQELDQWENWSDIRTWIREEGGIVYALMYAYTVSNGYFYSIKYLNTIPIEFVLYDFNLQIDDTLDYVIMPSVVYDAYTEILGPCYVKAIDIITTLDDVQRKRIILSKVYIPWGIPEKEITEEWIEGIGSRRGLFNTYTRFSSLLCLKESEFFDLYEWRKLL